MFKQEYFLSFMNLNKN